MRGLRADRTASTAIRGHAFVQNVRRGDYELGVEARHDRLRLDYVSCSAYRVPVARLTAAHAALQT
jgi:hypothetical protein